MSSINLRSQRSSNDYNTTSVTVQAVLTNIITVESSLLLRSGYYLMNSSGQPTDNEILSIDYNTNEITMSSAVSGINTGDTIVFSWERVVGQPLFNEDFDNSLYELNRTKLESNGSISATENFTFEKDIIGQQKLSIVDFESSGTTVLNGTLAVSGAAQFNDNIIIAGASPELKLESNKTLNIGDSSNTTNILGSLNVGLNLNINGTLSATGGVSTNVNGTVSSIANHTTDDLSEGSTNLYFTQGRARNSISVSGDLAYDPSTGVISFTERTDTEVRGSFSASEDLTYDPSSGEFSVTTYKDSDVDLHLNGGTGVSYLNGMISIGQDVGTNEDVTFNSVGVGGNSTLNNFSVKIEEISFTDGEIASKSFGVYDFNFSDTNLSLNSFVVVRPPTDTTEYPDKLFSGAHIIDDAGTTKIRLIIHNQGTQAWPTEDIDLDFGFLIIN